MPHSDIRTRRAPAPGATRATLPQAQPPQLATLITKVPAGDTWLSEIKFDGYRILASIAGPDIRLLTRNGLDWADRMPALADAFRRLGLHQALLDGELVALDKVGVSSFPALQSALKSARDDTLVYYAFDLLHLDGWDLRPCTLDCRKELLKTLAGWTGAIRYSDHVAGNPAVLHQHACSMHLEGIIAKKADAPYTPGRNAAWLKLKCQAREELVVLGWTPPARSRVGLGALHLGYHDPAGQLHYAGGVGTGFDAKTLAALRKTLDTMAARPSAMLVSGDPIDHAVTWVRPELVAEISFTGWSGAGRLRHAVFLGLREDKPAREVVRDLADPLAARVEFNPKGARRTHAGWHGAVPPMPKIPIAAAKPVKATKTGIVTAKAPQKARMLVGHVEISHPDRDLWPGITKQDLAAYWKAVAPHALAGLVQRPLSILRCPEGVGGEHFFQKNGHGHLPPAIREGRSEGQPFLAIDDEDGLFAMVQMSAIELHPWGAPESDPTRPDHLVFDLDPGESVPFPAVVKAAHDVRARLKRLGLESLCRTTGGKGLHVVVPITPRATWNEAKPFCRAFAETMVADQPDQYVAHVKIADRHGKILVDWLRNGLGATAVASFCPRARPGAGVATPLAWSEVTPKLNPAAFTVRTVPARIAKQAADPWAGYADMGQSLPSLVATPMTPPDKPANTSRIVTARKPTRK